MVTWRHEETQNFTDESNLLFPWKPGLWSLELREEKEEKKGCNYEKSLFFVDSIIAGVTGIRSRRGLQRK